MSTVAQILTRAQRQLLSGTIEARNKLSASLSSTATSISLTYDLNSIREGAVVQVDSELMYVWEVGAGTKSATVERGFNGTTAVSHASAAVVIVNPKFPRAQLLEALNDELVDLCSPMNGLFDVKTLDFNYNSSKRQTNIPVSGDIIDLVEVRYRYIASDYKQVNNVKLLRNLPTKDFGSGYGLQIDSLIPSSTVRVTYKTPFSRIGLESDDLQSIAGFPVEAEDILVMGIQIRAVAPREIKRNFTESQGETRRAEEVPVGAVGGSITNLLRLRRDRITAEAARLNRQYPIIIQRN